MMYCDTFELEGIIPVELSSIWAPQTSYNW
jgi:hypothetical protein